MAFKTAVVSVGTTATLLSGSDTDKAPGQSLAVKNTGDVTLFVGGSDVLAVTTAGVGSGYPLEPGESIGADAASSSNKLYGVVASGTCLAAVLRASA